MTDKFASGLMPYTDEERAADEEARWRKRIRGRKACPSGQDYNRKPTPADRRRDLRIVGESRDAD